MREQFIPDTMNSSNSSPMLKNDVLINILLRSDPSCIFNCILVCKEWLGIITEPYFRQDYLNIWTGHPKLLVGFLTYPHSYQHQRRRWLDPPRLTLVATSKLGRTIKTELEKPGYIISRSSSNNGFLLFGTFPHSLSAYKPFTTATHDLPSPPVHYKKVAVAIVTESSDRFKVIVAKTEAGSDHTLNIQTFSSSTGKWSRSIIACNRFVHLEGPGLVSSKGVVYWPSSGELLAYDTNKNRGIGNVAGPNHEVPFSSYMSSYIHHCYGVSPQGSICCAVHTYSTTVSVNNRVAGLIEVWVLDETLGKGKKKQRWKSMYKVDLEPLWAKHSSVLEPIFNGKPSVPFYLVSFVPGTTDRLYLELQSVLFLYHVDTQELDLICPKAYHDLDDYYKREQVYYDYKTAPSGFDDPCNRKYALSLAELGMWPVSSPTLRLR